MVCSLVKGQANDFLCLEKGEKGTNLALEFKISKQQISDFLCKNQEKILKFTDKFKMSEAFDPKSLKVSNDEQVDKALYACFFQQRYTGMPISGPLHARESKTFLCAVKRRVGRMRKL